MLLRRWPFTLMGAVGSFVVLWIALHQSPVYFTQLDAVLLPPEDTLTNPLREGQHALSPLAGLIVMDVNDGVPPVQLSFATTTLYGEGVRVGERVRLRNRGSQWQSIYDVPIVDVQVVAGDPESVRARALALVAELDRALAQRQASEGIRPSARVTLENPAGDPVVQQVGASRSRAAGAVAMLGAVLTFLAVALVDRRLLARRANAVRRKPNAEPEHTREPVPV
jgi:hypothetical protein